VALDGARITAETEGDETMTRWVVPLPMLVLAGCATASSSLVRGMTAPNPSGCYIQVFDKERLQGAADFINGPRRYSTLANLPNGARWNDRIRSLEVGPAATGTIWTGPNRTGKSMDIRLDRPYPVLPADFSGKVQSMDLQCADSRIAGDAQPSSLAEAK
jgi:hypothetical protein